MLCKFNYVTSLWVIIKMITNIRLYFNKLSLILTFGLVALFTSACNVEELPPFVTNKADGQIESLSSSSAIVKVSCLAKVNEVDSCIEYSLPGMSTVYSYKLSCEAGLYNSPKGSFKQEACNTIEFNKYACRDQLTVDGPLFSVFAKNVIPDLKNKFKCNKALEDPKKNPPVSINIATNVDVKDTFSKVRDFKDHLYTVNLGQNTVYEIPVTVNGNYNMFIIKPDGTIIVSNNISCTGSCNISPVIFASVTGLYTIKMVRTDSLLKGYKFSVKALDFNVPNILIKSTNTNRKYFANLTANHSYTYTLDMPSASNYDLILHKFTEDGYLVEVDSSTNATKGSIETITYTPSETGVYLVEVKVVEGTGNFQLLFQDNLVSTFTGNLTTAISKHNIGLIKDVAYGFSFTSNATTDTQFKVYVCSQSSASCNADTALVEQTHIGSGGGVRSFVNTFSTTDSYNIVVERTVGTGGNYTLSIQNSRILLNTGINGSFTSAASSSYSYTVNLVQGTSYNFDLNVAVGFNADLELCGKTTECTAGDDSAIRESKNAIGLSESILFTPTATGVYTIKVKNISGSGTYSLLVAESQTPTTLTTNSSELTQSVTTANFNKWYSVTFSKPNTFYLFRVSPSNNINSDLDLYNQSASQKISQSKVVGVGNKEYLLYTSPSTCTSQTPCNYKLRVTASGGNGSYGLLSKEIVTVESDFNKSDSFSSDSNLYYKINMNAYNPYTFAFTNLPSNSQIEIYNPSGDFVYQTNSSNFVYSPIASGVFAIKVSNSTSNANFSFKYQVNPIPLELYTWHNDNLTINDTSKWYSFNVVKLNKYRLWLYTNQPNTSFVNLELYTYGSNGTLQKSNIAPIKGTTASNAQLLEYSTTKTETVFFKVIRNSGEGKINLLSVPYTLPPYNFLSTLQPHECLVCISDRAVSATGLDL